jgi:hypothetical protein
MTRHATLLSITLALIACLIIAAPAAARAQTTTFSGMEITCDEAPPSQEWMSGNVLHIRSQIVTTRILTDDERVTGTNTIVLNFNLNLKNGSGSIYGTFRLQPDEVNGAWQGRFSGHFTNFVTTVHAVGHGTGDIAGLQEMITLHGADLPADNPCPSGSPVAATVVAGRSLDPHK